MSARKPDRSNSTIGIAVTAALAWWVASRQRRRWAQRRLRYFTGRLAGLRYRITGRHPAADVGDDVLTERVRSHLGQTTKALDLPHARITVSRRVVLLHGEVGSYEDAKVIEKAAHDVDGVEGVLSYLHVGLQLGTTRPSESARVYTPSAALTKLLAAAESAGVRQSAAGAAVHAVLATFVGRLPKAAHEHLFGHLPRDVQVLATPPRRRGSLARLRRFDDFIGAVLVTDHVDPTVAAGVSRAVLRALCELVPEEADHIRATLPHELRELWPSTVPA